MNPQLTYLELKDMFNSMMESIHRFTLDPARNQYLSYNVNSSQEVVLSIGDYSFIIKTEIRAFGGFVAIKIVELIDGQIQSTPSIKVVAYSNGLTDFLFSKVRVNVKELTTSDDFGKFFFEAVFQYLKDREENELRSYDSKTF